MKKIEKRAIMCLLLSVALIAGLCLLVYQDWQNGRDWAIYEGNRDVYADGDLAKGAVYDRKGELLMRNTKKGMKFNEDSSVRAACMHITGDKDNNISTGVNRAFLDRLIGYDFVNGIYSLNNKGEDIQLTLDSGLCAAAYDAMAGRKGTVGVYNYQTGEILCMVSCPTYDPENVPYEVADGTYINRFVHGTFAPGSTFKVLTTAAAIENGITDYTYTCYGSEDYGHGDYVTDVTPHYECDLTRALEVSCNCYYGKLSEKLGSSLIKEYVKKANLNSSYNIDGIETKKSTFDYPDGGVTLAWTGIGQWHDMVNPCAMMVFMGGIAGDGTAVSPSIILPGFVGETVDKIIPPEKIEMIDEDTAQKLKKMMHNNVEAHYGGEGYFPGISKRLCAKTGTAEVASQSQPNSWFVGFLDDSKNPYAFVVLVEEGGYGIDAAGSVANTVLQYLVD